MDGDRQPRAVVRTALDERTPALSPDGRWLAYASDETRRPEIFVQAFPGPVMTVSISPGPGLESRAPSLVLERDGVVGFDVAPHGRFLIAHDLTPAPLLRVVVALGAAAQIGRKAP